MTRPYTIEVRIRPTAIGQQLGGRYPVVMECPVCHGPAWRKSLCTFVHDAVLRLDEFNEPELVVLKSHRGTKKQMGIAPKEPVL